MIASPGGVKTNFAGSIKYFPRHPAYDNDEAPLTSLRKFINDPNLPATVSKRIHSVSLFARFASLGTPFEFLGSSGSLKKGIETREASGNSLNKQC
jgi:hypothetical protein